MAEPNPSFTAYAAPRESIAESSPGDVRTASARADAAPKGGSGVGGLFLLLRTRKALLLGAVLASTIAVAASLVPFFVIAEIARGVAQPAATGLSIWELAWVAAAAMLVRYFFVAVSTICAHAAAFQILYDLRMRIARKLGEVPLSFFSERRTGDIKRTIIEDVDRVEAFVAHHFPDGVSALLVPTLIAPLLFVIDWRMALASLAMAPVAGVAMGIAMRGVESLHQEWFVRQDAVNSEILEFLRGIQVIKMFGVTARSFGQLAQRIEENTAWVERLMRKNGNAFAIYQVLIGSSWLVLLPVGGMFYLDGSLDLGHFVLFLVLGPQVLAASNRLVYAFESVKRIAAGTTRVAQLLQAPSLAAVAHPRSPLEHDLRFKQVSFAYAEAPGAPEALTEVSFTAPAARVTALVGPSGAGKSTVARLVPRLYDVDRGAVEIGGVDIRDMTLDDLLARVSIVFQEVFLFHGSVKDNLRLARPSATDAQLQNACELARAHEFVVRLPQGYDTMLGERGARLSGGEKQRLSIARAILKDAPILVLDEATAFADAQNESLIYAALADACAQRTVLVITHRMATAAAADHVVVLERGRVVEQGTHAELLANAGLYRRLCEQGERTVNWQLGAARRGCEGGAA